MQKYGMYGFFIHYCVAFGTLIPIYRTLRTTEVDMVKIKEYTGLDTEAFNKYMEGGSFNSLFENFDPKEAVARDKTDREARERVSALAAQRLMQDEMNKNNWSSVATSGIGGESSSDEIMTTTHDNTTGEPTKAVDELAKEQVDGVRFLTKTEAGGLTIAIHRLNFPFRITFEIAYTPAILRALGIVL